ADPLHQVESVSGVQLPAIALRRRRRARGILFPALFAKTSSHLILRRSSRQFWALVLHLPTRHVMCSTSCPRQRANSCFTNYFIPRKWASTSAGPVSAPVINQPESTVMTREIPIRS